MTCRKVGCPASRVLLAASVLTLGRRRSRSRRPELASIFESITETAEAIEVEPPRPDRLVPVRGLVDFGEADARFGAWRGGRTHEGQDVFAKAGTPLVAIRDRGRWSRRATTAAAATTSRSGARDATGRIVYLHMRSPTRSGEGDARRAGQRVGAVGCTGSCWGDHLHLEMRHGRGHHGQAARPAAELKLLAGRAR